MNPWRHFRPGLGWVLCWRARPVTCSVIPDLEAHDTFVKRTEWGALILGAAGGLVLALLGYWGWAAGFVLGSAVSLGNFHLIVRGVSRLVAAPPEVSAGRRVWSGAALRFLVAGAALVLAVLVLRVNVLALLAGLVVTQVGMLVYWLLASLRTRTTPGA